MSDEKTSQMSNNIGKRVKNYLIIFTSLVIFMIWKGDILSLLNRLFSGQKDEFEFSKNLITTAITLIIFFIMFFLNFGRDINLHNFIDQYFFHVRKKTNQIIQEKMMASAKELKAENFEYMDKDPNQVLNIFYHFVNEQKVLRDLAFKYWEDYFVNIYIISIGLIVFLFTTVITITNKNYDYWIPVFILVLVVIVSLSTKLSLIPKIYKHPIDQIDEIIATRPEDFKQQVHLRFERYKTETNTK